MSLLRLILEYRAAFGQHDYWYTLQKLQTSQKTSSTSTCHPIRQATDQGLWGPGVGPVSAGRDCSSMDEQSLLEGMPATAFEALVGKVQSQDLASLRGVSRSLCKRTTEHIPYVELRLCESSTTDQLQQWRSATIRMQHAKTVTVLIHNGVPGDVFDSMMHMLSDCRNISSLYLYASNSHNNSSCTSCSSSGSRAHVPTLLPIKHLLGQLESLTIQGVIFDDLATDLWQLEAAASAGLPGGGWSLKYLDMGATWSSASCSYSLPWQLCAASLMHLTKAFSSITELFITIPQLDYFAGPLSTDPEPPSTPELHGSAGSVDSHVAGQLAQVAVVAALANAVVQLQSLEVLAVSKVTDIWCPGWMTGSETSSAAVTAAMVPSSCAAFADVALADGALRSTREAAAAFRTLDDCGCWLLQQHPKLDCMRLEVTGSYGGTKMTWNKQRQEEKPTVAAAYSSRGRGSAPEFCNTPPAAATARAAATPLLCNLRVYHAADQSYPCYQPHTQCDSDSQADSDNSSGNNRKWLVNNKPLTDSILRRLDPFSWRPAVKVLSKISSLRLRLKTADVSNLADLLDNLKSLRYLEVWLTEYNNCYHDHHTIRSAVASAARVTGLQALVLNADHGQHVLSNDLLLPLTAATGGPGSSLTKLELGGMFVAEVQAKASAEAEEPRVTEVNNTDVAAGTAAEADNENRTNISSNSRKLQQHTPEVVALGDSEQQIVVLHNISATTASFCAASSHPLVPEALPQNQALGIAADSLCDNARMAGPIVVTHRSNQHQQPAATVVGSLCAWHQPLQQLTGLVELTITHTGLRHLRLPVESLPTSLESLTCSRLNITSAAATAASPSVSSVPGLRSTKLGNVACSMTVKRPAAAPCTMNTSSDNHQSEAAHSGRLRLLILDLTDCIVGDLGLLQSHRLWQLSVTSSTWSGGWEAAAGAWPNLSKLEWRFDPVGIEQSNIGSTSLQSLSSVESDLEQMHQTTTCVGSDNHQSSSSSGHNREAGLSSSKAEDAGVGELSNICSAFKTLQFLTVTDLSYELAIEELQLLVPHAESLRYLQLLFEQGGNSKQDCSMLQKWLQQQMPWVSVSIASAVVLSQ